MKNKIKVAIVITLLSSINVFGQKHFKIFVNNSMITDVSKVKRINENDIIKLKFNNTKNAKINDIKFILVMEKRCCNEQVVNDAQHSYHDSDNDNDDVCEILIGEIDKTEDLADLSLEVLQFTLNDIIETSGNCKGTVVKLKMSYWLKPKEKKVEVYKFYLKL